MGNIIIQKGYNGREVAASLNFAYVNEDYDVFFSDGDLRDFKRRPAVIIGTVEFLESIIWKHRPNYYPEWSKDFWFRAITEFLSFDDVKVGNWFIKPSDSYKRFDGRVIYEWSDTDPYPMYIPEDFPVNASEVVEFVDEWRYYVANGKVLTSWWYQGSDETCENDPHGPRIDHMPIPEDYCGAIDMGILSTGELALVEIQHPYAIGWYGENSGFGKYIEFLEKGLNQLY